MVERDGLTMEIENIGFVLYKSMAGLGVKMICSQICEVLKVLYDVVRSVHS